MKTLTNYASRDTVHVPDSGWSGFRPHSQRRDREGVAPSSLTLELYWQHHRRGQQTLSSSVIAAEAHPVTQRLFSFCSWECTSCLWPFMQLW